VSNAELRRDWPHRVSRGAARCAAIAFAACAALLPGAARSHAASPQTRSAPAPGGAAAAPLLAPLARSFSHPVRVVGAAGHAADAIRLLADAERAYDAVTLGLGMPEPDVDPVTTRITVTLDEAPAEPLAVHLVRQPLYAYDRAFAEIHLAATWAPGCARDHALAQGFARAALARLSPAIDERDARVPAASRARLRAVSGGGGDGAAHGVARSASAPEMARASRSSIAGDRRASAARAKPWASAWSRAHPGAQVAARWISAKARSYA
jgi:hypothetical protein